MRHMLMQISPLSDLVRQVIWGLCRAASRGAPGRRTSGAKSKYTQRSRRHSCRLSSSVTVRATYPMLGGVVMLACLHTKPGRGAPPQSKPFSVTLRSIGRPHPRHVHG